MLPEAMKKATKQYNGILKFNKIMPINNDTVYHNNKE